MKKGYKRWDLKRLEREWNKSDSVDDVEFQGHTRAQLLSRVAAMKRAGVKMKNMKTKDGK